jgi:hypothetical protein
MTAAASSPERRAPTGGLLGEFRRREPLLTAFTVLMLAMMAPTAVALALDPRQLNDIPIWRKPLKFEASVAIYFGTLAWFVGFITEEGRKSRILRIGVLVAVAAMTIEMFWIIFQPARGLHSHFNEGTPLDSIMFGVMGVSALIFTALAGIVGWTIARHPRPDLAPAFRRTVVLALLLTTVFGMATGILIAENGGHWIGAPPTDAGGLPIFGWTRQGGDLRVGHFFGLHAMHILPVAGFLIALWRPRAVRLVTALCLLYAVFNAAVIGEALAGRPFLPFLG